MRNLKNIRILISGLLLLLAWVFHLTDAPGIWKDIALIVTTVLAGFPIAKKAIQTARMRMFSIELLVTIAVIGALIIGQYVESGVVTFLFLFGGFLEAKTLARARASIRNLVAKSPSKATVLRDGETYEVTADKVRKKDVVIIQSGGKIPVDGSVLSGHGEIIEAADVVLMSDRLDKLNYAYELAKATVRNMKQNMYFSVFVVLLLLAGVLTGHIFLASGMLIHEASVMIVILNALRLVRFPKGVLYQLHKTLLWRKKPVKQDMPIHPKKDYPKGVLDVSLVEVC